MQSRRVPYRSVLLLLLVLGIAVPLAFVYFNEDNEIPSQSARPSARWAKTLTLEAEEKKPAATLRTDVIEQLPHKAAALATTQVLGTGNTTAKSRNNDANKHHIDAIPTTTAPNHDAVYAERIDHLQEACEKLTETVTETQPGGLDEVHSVRQTIEKNFFVARRYHLVFCAVEKVGSSFWKRALRALNDLAPMGALFSQSGLSSHIGNEQITFENRSARWQKTELKKSLKFLFVRNPFHRTFSAYMDKIFLPFGTYFVHRDDKVQPPRVYRKTRSARTAQNLTTEPECRLQVPTFTEFIRQTVDEGVSLFESDAHYAPIHQHCDPCTTRFDVVGKMETFRQDAEHVLAKAGLKLSEVVADDLTFEAQSDLNIMTDIALRTMASPLWGELRKDPKCWLARDELLRRMWTVFQVRGLISKTVSFPLTMSESAKATHPSLLLAIKNGFDSSGDKERRLWQREAAMTEAFRAVPLDHLAKLQRIHRVDCMLFGYDCSLRQLSRWRRRKNGTSRFLFFEHWQ